jgi:dipeptidyl aminopeptidase/acylaminoacyl peptidase
MIEFDVKSTIDGSLEKNLLYMPEGAKNAPLVVVLHTWSADRFNQIKSMPEELPKSLGWAVLMPEFRGPNLTINPRAGEACASTLAMQDIMDAVEYVCDNYSIDRSHIFLMGGSGGGHMSLMMAAYAPRLWRAVSSWCPITDLAAWHGQNPNYADHIAACCGGVPGANAEVDREYADRSPLTHVNEIAEATVFVHHGRFDPSVPYTHTWRLAQMVEALGSKSFFFEIFNGGHDMYHEEALKWFEKFIDKDTADSRLTG